jgi:hypothetical protein
MARPQAHWTWAASPGCTIRPNRCRRADCTTCFCHPEGAREWQRVQPGRHRPAGGAQKARGSFAARTGSGVESLLHSLEALFCRMAAVHALGLGDGLLGAVRDDTLARLSQARPFIVECFPHWTQGLPARALEKAEGGRPDAARPLGLGGGGQVAGPALGIAGASESRAAVA